MYEHNTGWTKKYDNTRDFWILGKNVFFVYLLLGGKGLVLMGNEAFHFCVRIFSSSSFKKMNRLVVTDSFDCII